MRMSRKPRCRIRESRIAFLLSTNHESRATSPLLLLRLLLRAALRAPLRASRDLRSAAISANSLWKTSGGLRPGAPSPAPAPSSLHRYPTPPVSRSQPHTPAAPSSCSLLSNLRTTHISFLWPIAVCDHTQYSCRGSALRPLL